MINSQQHTIVIDKSVHFYLDVLQKQLKIPWYKNCIRFSFVEPQNATKENYRCRRYNHQEDFAEQIPQQIHYIDGETWCCQEDSDLDKESYDSVKTSGKTRGKNSGENYTSSSR